MISLDAFNHNTNLSIGGTQFALLCDDPALDVALAGFGGIVGPLSAQTRVVFVDSKSQIRQALQANPGTYPLVIADVVGEVFGGYPELSPGPRPGIAKLRDGSRECFVVDCSKRHDQSENAAGRIDWARAFMPVSGAITAELGSGLAGKRVGIVLVLEPKTAVLALSLQSAGAEVAVHAPANEFDSAVAGELRSRGIKAFENPDDLAAWSPEYLIDDGGRMIPECQDRGLLGAAEETTSGVRPLRQLEAAGGLHVPVIAVNDAHAKTFFDNRHGTGQTCAFAISHEAPTATSWAVIGFGPVGEGVAQAGRALGKSVAIVEVDPSRALQARWAGYSVLTMDEALDADVVISATGYAGTITEEHLARSKATFAVAGGAPNEAPEAVLAGGHGINYTLAEGNPVEIMDLSFACQLFALKQLISTQLHPGMHELDPGLDKKVAELALRVAASGYKKMAQDATKPEVTVYSANLVIPVTAPEIPDGAVAVRGDRIIHVGERKWVIAALRDEGTAFTEEHWDGVLTPGLVNAHTHLQYTGMADVGAAHYLGFEDWVAAFDAVYDAGPQDWLAASLRGAQLALRSGTTSMADVVTDIEAAPALAKSGMHGIAYWEVMGWSNKDWQDHGRTQTLGDLEKIPRIPGAGVSPHAPYSLEVQPLLEVPDLVRNLGLRLHIHLGEAHFERETRSEAGWASRAPESFKDLRRSGVGVSSTEFVDQLGVLGPDCHIAHGVYMSARDRALLRARGTSVALCPRSNIVIGLDAPPIADYLREGNQISVGTDSLSSSPSLDLLEDVQTLYSLAREQGYHGSDLHARLFMAATLGGAGSLGLRAGKYRAGQLAVGAMADLAFFEVGSLEELVEAGAGTARRTILAGKERYSATNE